MPVFSLPTRRGQTRRRRLAPISEWRHLLVPTKRLEVSCPRGLHRATYKRLVNEYNRVLDELAALPRRRLWPRMRKAYELQYLNRIVRIRRRLGLPTPKPRARGPVPHRGGRTVPGRVHEVRPALDGERLPPLRACRRVGRAPLLHGRGAAPRAAETEDLTPTQGDVQAAGDLSGFQRGTIGNLSGFRCPLGGLPSPQAILRTRPIARPWGPRRTSRDGAGRVTGLASNPRHRVRDHEVVRRPAIIKRCNLHATGRQASIRLAHRVQYRHGTGLACP